MKRRNTKVRESLDVSDVDEVIALPKDVVTE